MGRIFAGLGIVAAIAALLAWNFYYKPRRDAAVDEAIVQPLPLDERSALDSLPDEPELEPEPEPVPEFVAAAPAEEVAAIELPSLDDSDATVLDMFSERFSADALALVVPESVVRKVVVTVDNLPRKSVSMKIRALAATPDRFVVAGSDDDVTLDPDNYARYQSFLTMLDSVEPDAAVDLYVGLYPLLQEAYEGLGYPGQQFHGRVIEVIEHLLAAPDVSGPVRLERPHVLYRFADPELEARSAGQKALIRMGSDNAGVTKAWLGQFRDALLAREIS